jgi:hypothetical protein
MDQQQMSKINAIDAYRGAGRTRALLEAANNAGPNSLALPAENLRDLIRPCSVDGTPPLDQPD